MKKHKQSFVAVLILVCMLLLGIGPFPIQATTTGCLTLTPICTDKGQTAIKGTIFDLYRIATRSDDGQWVPVQALTDSSVDVRQWQSEKKVQQIATLVGQKQLPVTVSGKAAADGSVVFDSVAEGLYLVVQHNTVEGYTKALPFVVAVPMQNPQTGDWEYNVVAQPKVENVPMPQPSKPNPPTNKPSQSVQKPSLGALFQTGQLSWPIPLLIIGGGVALVAGGYLVRSAKRKK